ncbi:unnamed protein product [Didymodactylos carnosus]|uniref:Uncharacterized protein n=1 Tax=Didymodactylos carnosus TaxID=1234261 RepID=A0A814C1R7_9BILA|nr:unnamed protein product [Didymodactylos carnosus]CAF0984214.1 unnamed protein product [Didymodactylos carnosus]CAF3711611.1 unnamed protein product [Didymodactylos carnosus]CAF3754599.1 unnamed protein product [Didymodactylos carnosus]
MKYLIRRQFSITSSVKKFEIQDQRKNEYKVKAKLTNNKLPFNIKISNIYKKDEFCIIERDKTEKQCYQISLNNKKFATIKYYFVQTNNVIYHINIGSTKQYSVSSNDLKYRALTIIDVPMDNLIDNVNNNDRQILIQVSNQFSKLTDTYHVIVNDIKYSLGYLAIAILLDLHERKRQD